MLLPTVLSNFVKLGIPQASVYYMRRKNVPASEVASNSLWFAITMGTRARDRLLVRPRLAARERPASRRPSRSSRRRSILVPCVLLQFYFLGVAQAQERFKEYNVRQIVPNLLSLVGMFVVLVVLGKGLVAAVLTQTAIVIFMSIWLTIARASRGAAHAARERRTLLKDMLGFGAKSYVQTLAATLHLRIDQFVLSPTSGARRRSATTASASTIVGLLLKISEATGTVVFPRLAASDRREAQLATARVVPAHALPDRDSA